MLPVREYGHLVCMNLVFSFLLNREINNEIDQNTLLKDIQNLEKWAINWGMRFNAKKCYMLSLRKKIQDSYKLDGHTLEQVPSNP
jgi:hypothetical protein